MVFGPELVCALIPMTHERRSVVFCVRCSEFEFLPNDPPGGLILISFPTRLGGEKSDRGLMGDNFFQHPVYYRTTLREHTAQLRTTHAEVKTPRWGLGACRPRIYKAVAGLMGDVMIREVSVGAEHDTNGYYDSQS